MPRKKKEATTRAPKGQGSVKQRTITRNGKTYISWRARCFIPDPDTGIPQLREFTGSSQKEALAKMQEAQKQVALGTYQPRREKEFTLAEWIDVYTSEYLNSVKHRTRETYTNDLAKHVKTDKISKLKLTKITPLHIQKLYNGFTNRISGEPLNPKTVKNVHAALHQCLQKAVDIGLLRFNPTDKADLPKIISPEIKPLDEHDIENFLSSAQKNKYYNLFVVALFTGMRKGEIRGLSWDEVDFENGLITIKHQLDSKGRNVLLPTKNSKPRTLRPAPSIMQLLKSIKTKQFQQMLEVGSDNWRNELNLVFTHSDGSPYSSETVYLNFKRIAEKIGRPDARFHDLRHSYAVQSIRNGDDLKTIQNNLGHSTASFTLQVYGHVPDTMMLESAERMDKFIKNQKIKIS